MSIANTCVLIAALLPIATIGIAKASTAKLKRQEGGFDNRHPREWMAKLQGWQARAAAAQNNGFESLPLFIFAVVMAQLTGVEQGRTDILAQAYIVTRVVYTGLYIADKATLRSIVWAVGLGITIAIMAPALSTPF